MRSISPGARHTTRPPVLTALVAVGVLVALLAASSVVVLFRAEPAAAAGSWSSETVAGMNVRIYTPTSAPAIDGQRALMINLHGCIQTNANLQAGGNWPATADKFGMVIAVPAAPDGGVVAGCWDYYGSNHSRTGRHDDNLIELASTLTARPALNIDADQVYISGLSSGGGETMVMGCLAPEVFAGIGINAGPTVGTSSSQIGSVATTQAAATSTCRNFAGTHADAFSTQLTSIVYGDGDYTVAQGYNTLNADVMAGIYGASQKSTFSLTGLPGANTAGTGTAYSDEEGRRVSLIKNNGLGHAWPAGGGPGGSYISTNSVNYPEYLTSFFFENNRRVDGTVEPTEPPTTTPPPTTPPSATCWTVTNAAHRAAGRAISYGSNPYNPYYAVGSLDYLGQGDATVTSVEMTGQGRFDVVAACP